MKKIFLPALFLLLTGGALAQAEILTNAAIVEMSKIGLEKEIILKKINDSPHAFRLSVSDLIELKKANVADEVIRLMLEKGESRAELPAAVRQDFSESRPDATERRQFSPATTTVKDALLNARTVAIAKSSLNPSRQALEKALLKRKEWGKYDLSLVRYKNEADLYIEIGRIPFSWITHRYVFRVFDRRSGKIITAGETTSWGSLAENLAREITQKIDAVSGR